MNTLSLFQQALDCRYDGGLRQPLVARTWPRQRIRAVWTETIGDVEATRDRQAIRGASLNDRALYNHTGRKHNHATRVDTVHAYGLAEWKIRLRDIDGKQQVRLDRNKRTCKSTVGMVRLDIMTRASALSSCTLLLARALQIIADVSA